MTTVSVERITAISEAIFAAAGASLEEARVVTEHLVSSSLAGHDSHGIISLPTYVDRMKKGHIKPGAKIEIMQETPTTTVVNGNWGFGFVVSEYVTRLTIEKAKKYGVAAATIYQQSHIGRLSTYPLMAAEQGMIAMMTADSGRGPKSVVPFGGSEPRLGTNPISFAVPSNLDGPFCVDMATSAVAGGKISVAAARGEQIPTGWIIDRDGNDSTDPSLRSNDGAWLLPLGGTEGHKGYALGAMVEVLCGILTGLGFGVSPTGIHNDGCFLAVFDVEAFRPLATFKQEVTDFAAFLKDTPPLKGSKGVFYPGEIEHMMQKERQKNGIEIEQKTWDKLVGLAKDYGVADRLGLSVAA